MHKMIILFLLIGAMCVSCFACSDFREPVPEETPESTSSAEPTPTVESTPKSTHSPTQGTSPIPSATGTGTVVQATTYDADTLYAASKVQGRVLVYDYLNRRKQERRGISLDYTASSIEFTARCEGSVSINLCGIPKGTAAAPIIYVNFYVDGKLLPSRSASGIRTEQDFVLAENLMAGTHTFKIERQNEAEKGVLYVNSVTLQGTLGKKPANSKLYIEFIGDSITTGYGNLYPNLIGDVKPSKEEASSCYQDGTQAYAYLTAKKLGADYSIVAQQGIGASVGWQPHTMLQTYTETCYQTDKHTSWNFARQPDLIVINLGTNDLGCPATTGAAAVQKGFVDLLKLVRSKNPNAKILWVYGAMDTSGAPVVEAAVKEAGGSSKGFYAYTKLKPNNQGGVGHPVVSAHEKNANLLVAEIKRLLNL